MKRNAFLGMSEGKAKGKMECSLLEQYHFWAHTLPHKHDFH